MDPSSSKPSRRPLLSSSCGRGASRPPMACGYQAPWGPEKGLEMIALKTTWENISAWLRIEMRSANGPSFLIKSCAIFASAAPLSRTSFGAKFSAERTIASRVPEHWPRPTYFNGWITQAMVLRKIGHGIVSFALRFPAHVLGPGEKSSRKAPFEVEALSNNAVLVGSRPEAGGGHNAKTAAHRHRL